MIETQSSAAVPTRIITLESLELSDAYYMERLYSLTELQSFASMLIIVSAADYPRVMHYGRLFTVKGYSFRKHWYHLYDPHTCPPWPEAEVAANNSAVGIFRAPPHPSEINMTVSCW